MRALLGSLALAGLLGGCAPTLDRTAISFDPTQPNALLIVGVGCVYTGIYCNLTVRSADGDRSLSIPSKEISGRTTTADAPPEALVKYSYFLVPPGQYILEKLESQTDRSTATTRFVGSDNKTPNVTFTLNPGEIGYIGDLVFNVGYRGRLVSYQDRRDALAQDMKNYPAIKGPIVFKNILPKPELSL